jgi:hypothetical protein
VVVFQVGRSAISKAHNLSSDVMGPDNDLDCANRSSSEEPNEPQPRLRRSKSMGSTAYKGVMPEVSTEELGTIRNSQARQKRGVVSFTKSDQEQINDREKRPKPTLPPRKPPTSRFGCPFYKHAPELHKTRKACHACPGFESIHRVKYFYRPIPFKLARC